MSFFARIEDKALVIPLFISIVASSTQALGISLQRRSHLAAPNIPSWKRPLWLTGFLVYTLSNLVASACTIGYLPIVILAPVGAIGLVFNAIFARIVLGDPFTTRTTLGTTLIVIGAMLIAGFGVVPEPNHTLQDLIRLYQRPTFIIYFALVEFITCFGLLVTHLLEYSYKSNPASWTIKYPNIKMWLGVSYGAIGANISSQAMLFAKSGLELLILSIFHGDNQFIYPLTWVLLLALIITAVLQLYYLNRGVQLCDTIILVPLNFCSFNVSCLFNGLVYYDQWDRLFWWQVIFVLVGIAILVLGVLVISFGSTGTDNLSVFDAASKSSDASDAPPVDAPHPDNDKPASSKWIRLLLFRRPKRHTPVDETTPLIHAS
ncbi:magnesium transporter NIPA-domain-containing protein [Gongronella butleri]|nr:magnesium transporter NIPA-domain-containing protein [Gongronella butleri]